MSFSHLLILPNAFVGLCSRFGEKPCQIFTVGNDSNSCAEGHFFGDENPKNPPWRRYASTHACMVERKLQRIMKNQGESGSRTEGEYQTGPWNPVHGHSSACKSPAPRHETLPEPNQYVNQWQNISCASVSVLLAASKDTKSFTL